MFVVFLIDGTFSMTKIQILYFNRFRIIYAVVDLGKIWFGQITLFSAGAPESNRVFWPEFDLQSCCLLTEKSSLVNRK